MAEREATLFVQGGCIEAAIVDASDGGVGVIVADPASLSLGQAVEFQELDPPGAKRAARITHIEPTDFSLTRVGLQWV
jgi:hypothetical protein